MPYKNPKKKREYNKSYREKKGLNKYDPERYLKNRDKCKERGLLLEKEILQGIKLYKKKCVYCNKEKLITGFPLSYSQTKDGHANYCKECRAKKVSENHNKKRKFIIDKLGGKCIKCGFNDYRALQIDHIHGGGRKERKEVIFNNEYILKHKDKYQILCANCNTIKKIENFEQPHSAKYRIPRQ